MSVLIGGVSCEELVKGYTESMDTKLQSTKRYLCPWNSRFNVLRGMLGFATASGRGAAIIFNPPFAHPELIGIYPTAVAITGVGRPSPNGGLLSFAMAIIEVTFGPRDWSSLPSDDPAGEQGIDPGTKLLYATQEITYGSEYVHIPGSNLKIFSGGGFKPYNNDKTIKIQHAEMSITLHQLPYLPTNFLPLGDNVNATTFLGGARGTVKFNGGSTHRDYQTDASGNSVTQSVTLSLSYRPRYEWNLAPNPYPGSNDWGILQYKSGNPFFPYSDLSVIFPPAYLYS